jgi:hypothetical protein
MYKSEFKNQKENRSKRYRNWFITIVYKKDIVTDKCIMSCIKKFKDVNYYTYQLERGNKAGKLHHHLFIRYRNPKTYNQIKGIFYSAHVQHISGPIQRVISYCTKEPTRVRGPYESGLLSGQGKRNDLAEISEMVKCGWTDEQIGEVYPSQVFLYHQNITVMRDKYYEKELASEYREITTTYIYGETETGKTRSIYQNYEGSDIYRTTSYKNAFDMYNGQDVMVFDEFRGQIAIADMLEYLDGYLTRLQARYHDKVARYKKVFIISNEPFEKLYPKSQISNLETYKAFCRRIDTIKEFTKNDNGMLIKKEYGNPKEYYRMKKKDELKKEKAESSNYGKSYINSYLEKDWFDNDDYLEYYNIGKIDEDRMNKISKFSIEELL